MSTYPFSTLPTEWSLKDNCDLSLQKILWRLFIAWRMKFKLLTMVYKTLNSPISVFWSSFTNLLLCLSWSCHSTLNTLQHLLSLYSLPELTTLCQQTYLCFIGAIQSSWISLCTQFLACKVNSYSFIKTQMKYHIPCKNFFSLYASFPFVLPYHGKSILCYKSYYHLHLLSNNLSSFHYVLGIEDISLNKTNKISNLIEFRVKS